MGEVYRARDTRLDRSVAIKVLPSHLSASPEVRARFEREARAASQLNHPNICVIHDVGHEGGIDYLVMEHLEGETLAARIQRGPLPTADVLRIATEIADALDRAHRAGIVHRDLKPGNVMLTKSGAKLLDFGLARATGLEPKTTDLTASPTVSQPLTAEGTILGTFHYMAPEQLEGVEADARCDLWALGCVIYEMATGHRAFEGKSQASLIAAILEKTPTPIAEQQPLSPPALDRLVGACLSKDPDERIQTAHDVKLQLRWIVEGGSQAGVPAVLGARRRTREAVAWAVAAVAVVAAAGLGALIVLQRPPAPRAVRFEIEGPPGSRNLQWPRLSPDGRMLAFVATDSVGRARVWIRPLDALEAVPVAGTEGAGRVFWSPDSKFLGFIADNTVRKVPVGGGPAIAIGQATGGVDGSWGSKDLILFDGSSGDSIRGIPASGGSVRPVTTIARARGEGMHAWPFFVPDGGHFLFVTYHSGASLTGEIRFGRIGSGENRDLGKTDGRVEYAAEGYLVFPRENTLMAQPFDVRAGRTTGDAVAVGEKVALGAASGDFSVNSGILVYRSQAAGELARLVWVDRSGKILGDAAPPGLYCDAALSPDAHRVALSILDPQKGTQDLWVRDLDRGVTSRLTFEPGDELQPVWSPDGQRIAYMSDRMGDFRPMVRLATGIGNEDTLATIADGPSGVTDWSRDGKTLALRHRSAQTNWDMWLLSDDPGAKPSVFLRTPFVEHWAAFSPEGRWIAYQSNESGRSEVYVQPTSGGGGKWQISVNGGGQPRWRADGQELFFLGPEQQIMAVSIDARETVQAGTPAQLFRLPLVSTRYGSLRWVPAVDGQRFLVLTPEKAEKPARFTVVTNWTTGLKR